MDLDHLTFRQREVLAFLLEYMEGHGYAPAIRDIAGHFNVQTNAARWYLEALNKKGAITVERGKARAITLVGVKIPRGGIPSLGCYVPANQSVESESLPESL